MVYWRRHHQSIQESVTLQGEVIVDSIHHELLGALAMIFFLVIVLKLARNREIPFDGPFVGAPHNGVPSFIPIRFHKVKECLRGARRQESHIGVKFQVVVFRKVFHHIRDVRILIVRGIWIRLLNIIKI
jgi:hypothetical protein